MAKKKNDLAVQQTNDLAVPKTISEKVLKRVEEMRTDGALVIPEDYSPANALNEAYLTLQTVKDKTGAPALSTCTTGSVANALLDMVTQGLSPNRKQCYFVVYDKELTLMRSYMGTIAVAKRFAGVKDVFAQVVYAGDGFEYEIDPSTGVRSVKKHVQSLASIDGGEILAAYATVIKEDGSRYQEIMTIKEIRAAWNQGQTKGGSPAHKNFPQEMAKKTVINRALKIFINSATDSAILAGAYNRTTENEYRSDDDDGFEVLDENRAEARAAAAELFFGEGEDVRQTIKNASDGLSEPQEAIPPFTDEEMEEILEVERLEALAQEVE